MQLTDKILLEVKTTFDLPKEKLKNPVLIQMCGAPCWGKTTLAKKICSKLPIVHISSDKIRKKIFPQAEHSQEETRFINDEIIETILRDFLKQGYSVILDLNIDLKKYRKKNEKLAKEVKVRSIVIMPYCSHQVAIRRLNERRKNPWRLSQNQEYIVPEEAYWMYVKKIQKPTIFEKAWKFNSEKNEDNKFDKLINYLKK